MRNINPVFHDALLKARDNGIAPRKFVYITAKRIDNGLPESLGFWSGDEVIDISVISPITGLAEGRTYHGAQNLEVSSFKNTSNLTTQSIDISLTQISPTAQSLLRGHDLRLAKVEVHEIVFEGMRSVSMPECIFLGEVDQAPLTTPSVDGDGEISISCVSDAISMLSIPNPLKSSYEGQKVRNNTDEFGLYASTIANWNIAWGRDYG